MLKTATTQRSLYALRLVGGRYFGHYKRDSIFINDEYLSNGIVSKNHAWFCGMLVTDGHLCVNLNLIKFDLQLQDYHLLENLMQCVHCNKRISMHSHQSGNSYCSINLVSERLVQDAFLLFPCNWRSKSNTLRSSFPLFDCFKSRYYASDYIRGVSDGDGSFGFKFRDANIIWTVASNSPEFIAGLGDIISAGCNVIPCIGWANNQQILTIAKQVDVLIFGDWIYANLHDKTPLCRRKYNRYLLWKRILHDNKNDRRAAMRQHKSDEILSRIAIHERVISLIDDPNAPFIFCNTFRNRLSVQRCKFIEWKRDFI